MHVYDGNGRGTGLGSPLTSAPVPAYFTIEASSAAAVDALARRAVALGGAIVTPAYTTYYYAHRMVLTDPEKNVFRINHRIGARVAMGADDFV